MEVNKSISKYLSNTYYVIPFCNKGVEGNIYECETCFLPSRIYSILRRRKLIFMKHYILNSRVLTLNVTGFQKTQLSSIGWRSWWSFHRENRDTQNINVSGKEVGRKSSNSQMNWAVGAKVWPQEWNKPKKCTNTLCKLRGQKLVGLRSNSVFPLLLLVCLCLLFSPILLGCDWHKGLYKLRCTA